MNVLKMKKDDGIEKLVCQFTYREYQDVAMSVMDTLSRRSVSSSKLRDSAMRLYHLGSMGKDTDAEDMKEYFGLIDFYNNQPNNPSMLDKPTLKNNCQFLAFNEDVKTIIYDIWLEAWKVHKKPLCSISDYFQTFYPMMKNPSDGFSDHRIRCLQTFANNVAIYQAGGASYHGSVVACFDDTHCDGMELDEILEALPEFKPAPVPSSHGLLLPDHIKTDTQQYEARPVNKWLEAKIQDNGYQDDEELADARTLRKYAEKLGLQRKYE